MNHQYDDMTSYEEMEDMTQFDIYSDIYKDVHGFRPRGETAQRFLAMTEEEKQAEFDRLEDELNEQAIHDEQNQLMSLASFIERMRARGNIREAILKEVRDANGDMEYVDYNWGLKYGTVKFLLQR